MEIKPESENGIEAKLAYHNLGMGGYEPKKPGRIVLGKSPVAEGWTDPVTDTVFVMGGKEPLIQHEAIHVDQYDRLLDTGVEFSLIKQMEERSLGKAENNLDDRFVRVSGLRNYPWIGNIETHLNAISDPSYITELSDIQSILQSETNNQTHLLNRFEDKVESLNNQRGFETWRDGPDYIQDIVDRYQEYI
ncbi:MAG: hypothetical protein J07AB43_14110, partial [Candidatus Nanosalina sp. J07AB43]